ncbi:MAG: hypothetical protein L3J13_01565 [Devosiaceae bacterium]|nr:hypothetical protein [Devosiaceae bacterium]
MFEPVAPIQTAPQPTPEPALPGVGADQPVSISAQIKEGGPIIPNGLVWRVFGKTTDETGKLPLLFRSEAATASFSLPPGEYVVHVSYGRAQSSDTLSVEVGPNIKSIVLEAGALRLHSAVTAEINIPPNQLKFDIFTEGLDGESIPVALDIDQGTMIQLNAGTFKVVSRWGEQNAIVRADIRVEPGEVTEATLFHKAAQVALSLVSKAGGEAIADVDWKVQDSEGESIYTHFGAFPSTVLAEGDYVVFAQTGDTVYNRQFQVRAGRPITIEVVTTVY